MNIHFVAGAKVDTRTYRMKSGDTKVACSTKPPRQRENLSGRGPGSGNTPGISSRLHRQKPYAGGKRLRRAMAKLHSRRDAYTPTMKPSGHGCTSPGTMKS